ncbi:MAG: peptidase S41, partial [Hyphomicrobiaceae bacterium]|nr:peptidase S41 [Hyphomicrobiaceae bacterium]
PSGRSIQATGIVPDIVVLQENLPEELVGRDGSGGEAGLRGHFGAQGEAEEAGGSSVYVPQDATLDTQLNYAFQLLRGEIQNAAFPPDPDAPVPN